MSTAVSSATRRRTRARSSTSRYHHAINSTELVTRLREEKSVLVVPGDHFGMDGYLRLGFGEEPGYLREGLNRVRACIAELGMRNADARR